jgi:hypothetical protein
MDFNKNTTLHILGLFKTVLILKFLVTWGGQLKQLQLAVKMSGASVGAKENL